jgi:circadian clock protein KaiB
MSIPLADPRDAGAVPDDCWTLRLYVAGQSPRSLRALANLRRMCAEELDARYRLEVIDLYQQPELAMSEQLVALPALIKRLPEPLRSIVGDMSDTERVLVGLDLLPKTPVAPVEPAAPLASRAGQ